MGEIQIQAPRNHPGFQCGISGAHHLDIQTHSGSNSISYMGMSSVSLGCCFPCQSLRTCSTASHLECNVVAPRRVSSIGSPNSSFSIDTKQGLLTCPLEFCSYIQPRMTNEQQELPRCQGWLSLFVRGVGEGSSEVVVVLWLCHMSVSKPLFYELNCAAVYQLRLNIKSIIRNSIAACYKFL